MSRRSSTTHTTRESSTATLPVLDGWEATKQIKQSTRTGHVPIIVLTGHVMPEDLRRARDAGADAILTKPCAPDVLRAVLEKLVPR